MGQAFEALPRPLRAMHGVIGDGAAVGKAHVRRGKSFASRLVAAIVRFPPDGEHDLSIAFNEDRGIERWTRDFGGHVFASELSQSGTYLVERVGPMRFFFDLPSDANGLEMVMRRWSVLGLRMPMSMAPATKAREWAEGEDFRFDIGIALPLIGDIVSYTGGLRRV